MAKIIGLPKLSPTMEEGTLVSWTKQEGDAVEVDDLGQRRLVARQHQGRPLILDDPTGQHVRRVDDGGERLDQTVDIDGSVDVRQVRHVLDRGVRIGALGHPQRALHRCQRATVPDTDRGGHGVQLRTIS